MNAETSSPTEKLPSRAQAKRANRWQALLYVFLTLILTVGTVVGGRIWLRNSETLTFATGNAAGVEARFAAKLATVLKNNGSRLRIKIVQNADNAKALTQFDNRQANLVVLRSDAKIPQRARALALLEHDVVLLISPGEKKIDSLAALRKKKIALLSEDDGNMAFARSFLEIPEGADAGHIQQAPPNATLDKLFAPKGVGAVIAIAHASKIAKDKSYEQYTKRGGSFVLNNIDEAKALTRKNPGISEEMVATGMLSSSPEVPDDDISTIGLQWFLVAQSRMSVGTAEDLARTVYENKAELALDDGFASKIEPADTDKDALIVAHHGAAGYINDDTKSFMDRYADVMYLGGGALSIIGSLFFGLYAQVTRIAPEKASELATAILDIGERIEHAKSMDVLESLQDELEAILRGAVIGLRDGTISSDGLDTFKLGYEFVRDEIAMRRESLKRHGDNIVMVKSAQSG